jgi:hypothetical protein
MDSLIRHGVQPLFPRIFPDLSAAAMNLPQRQARLERFFADLARRYALSLGLGYLGTIRQLPPPPLPGERLGATRYYVNGLAPKGGGTRLVEFNPPLYAAVRRAEAWVESGRGPAPEVAGKRGTGKRIKTSSLTCLN